MKLHEVLGKIGFISAIVGLSGIAGAIETGQGLIKSIVLLLVGAFLLFQSLKEGGYIAKHESDDRYYGNNDASYQSYHKL